MLRKTICRYFLLKGVVIGGDINMLEIGTWKIFNIFNIMLTNSCKIKIPEMKYVKYILTM